MIAIFVCPFTNSNAVTPPLQSDDAFHLQYTDPQTGSTRTVYEYDEVERGEAGA